LYVAVTCFRDSIVLDPKYAPAHSGLGSVLVKQKKTGAAVAAYRTAFELNPKSALVHRNLGNQLRIQGKSEEAIAVYREALKLDPTSARAYYGLGLTYGNKGLMEEATVAYHEALRLNANTETRSFIAFELNNRAWRLATNPDTAARHPKRAVELAKEAIALKPLDQQGTYWNTLGVAHYRVASWKKAVTSLT
jgi:tetratricopeptide (TPR) repeat protein